MKAPLENVLFFPKETFTARRRKFMDKIGLDSIVIVPGAMPQNRNADNDHPFRQNSDFYYLTGFPEPLALAVFIPGRTEGEYILFNRAHNPDKERFVGKFAGQDGAIAEFGADQSFNIQDLSTIMYPLFIQYKKLYLPMGGCHGFYPGEDKSTHSLEEILNEFMRKRRIAHLGAYMENYIDMASVHDYTTIIQTMRLVKEPLELEFIQRAVDISMLGHMRTLQAPAAEKKNEMTISSQFLHEIMHHDTQEVAYPNIVGAGKHSCVLHYQKNNSKIHDGDMILIDSGAEYKNYASDITRSFPVNGKFSAEQQAIYDLVESTQQQCIEMVRPGLTLYEIHVQSLRLITEGLLNLGILHGDTETLLASKACLAFYMHGVGHWLGLDMHDTTALNLKTTHFEPNMVLTVEPGIYIDESETVDKRWHNIGVRIEDDVVVTESGYRVMSEALPKKAGEIEKVMQGWVPAAIERLGYQPRFFSAFVTGEKSANTLADSQIPSIFPQ